MNRADIKTAALARADYLNSNFVPDAVLNVWFAQAFRELFDIVVLAHPDTYSGYEDLAVPSTGVITTPSTAYKIRHVELDPGTSAFSVPRFNFAERNRTRLAYRDRGASIEFMPAAAAAGRTARVWFVPKAAVPTDDSTALDATMEAYSEYLVSELAAKTLEKAEDFEAADRIRMRKNDLENKLRAMIPRDVGEPEVIADVTGGWPDGVPSRWGW